MILGTADNSCDIGSCAVNTVILGTADNSCGSSLVIITTNESVVRRGAPGGGTTPSRNHCGSVKWPPCRSNKLQYESVYRALDRNRWHNYARPRLENKEILLIF